jgi:hypothetical protein
MAEEYLSFPRFMQRYEKTETNDSEGAQISYEPAGAHRA